MQARVDRARAGAQTRIMTSASTRKPAIKASPAPNIVVRRCKRRRATNTSASVGQQTRRRTKSAHIGAHTHSHKVLTSHAHGFVCAFPDTQQIQFGSQRRAAQSFGDAHKQQQQQQQQHVRTAPAIQRRKDLKRAGALIVDARARALQRRAAAAASKTDASNHHNYDRLHAQTMQIHCRRRRPLLQRGRLLQTSR